MKCASSQHGMWFRVWTCDSSRNRWVMSSLIISLRSVVTELTCLSEYALGFAWSDANTCKTCYRWFCTGRKGCTPEGTTPL